MSPRRVFLPLALACAAACTQETPPDRALVRTAATHGQHPDVLLVSIDSLRADHLGCYGYPKPTSPHLDAFARSGVRCATAISTTSWTLPAHAALFTGLYDSTHGVVDNGLALAPQITTLAEVLRAHGYHTAGFYGGPYLHPVFGLSQGFESWESCMSASGTPDALVRSVLDPAERASADDVTGPRTLAAVTEKLRTAAKDEPLFLFVHLWDVHYDYRPPEEYWRRFDPDYTGTLDARDLAHNAAIRRDMPPRELAHVVALYDGEIAFTDEVLGGILAAWDAARDPARSLVVVTADHGEEFFEHGNKGHQHSLFEEVVHVPLVARWPGHFDGGRAVQPLVRLVDVMPTICAAAGASEGLRVQGRDLAPLFAGQPLEPASALCELLVDGGEARALRRDGHKTIRYKDGRLVFTFDLLMDPRELASIENDAVKRDGLALLADEVVRARAFAKELAAPPRRISVDDAVQRALSKLGYSDGDGAVEKQHEEKR